MDVRDTRRLLLYIGVGRLTGVELMESWPVDMVIGVCRRKAVERDG